MAEYWVVCSISDGSGGGEVRYVSTFEVIEIER